MRAFELTGGGIDGLALVERDDRDPGPGEVEVRVEATSLNYRDLMMAQRTQGVIPVSDGAGVVTRVGSGVTDVAVGDRVAGTFFSHWVDGRAFAQMHEAALGGSVDGMLASSVILPAHGVIPVPAGWSSARRIRRANSAWSVRRV